MITVLKIDRIGGPSRHRPFRRAALVWSTPHAGAGCSRFISKPWHSNREGQFAQGLKDYPEAKFDLDANHAYTLAELVDLAEGAQPGDAHSVAERQGRGRGVGHR